MSSVPMPSPCIGVCRIDGASGWCLGCLRTLDEIAAWSLLDDGARRAVWVRIGQRRIQRRDAAAGRPAPGGAP